MPQHFIEIATIIIIGTIIFYRPSINTIHLIIGDIVVVVFAVLCPTYIILCETPRNRCPRTVLNCASGNNIKLLQSWQGQFISANCLFRASFWAASRKTSTLSRYSGSTLDTLYIQYTLSSIFKPNNMGKPDIN